MADRKGGSIPGTPNARHGGQATKAKYGTEHYSRLGKKGGTAVKEAYGPKDPCQNNLNESASGLHWRDG